MANNGTVNKAIVCGFVGHDLELRSAGETSVCNVRIATDESYKDKAGNKVERTEWHSAVIWGKAAEAFCKYTKKGDKVYLEGSLFTRDSEGSDGVKYRNTELKVTEFTWVQSKLERDAGKATKSVGGGETPF